MRRPTIAIASLVALCEVVALLGWVSGAEEDQAQQILAATGVKGGLVVHLGCGDGKLTAALGRGGSYVVQGLDADKQAVGMARKNIEALGLYGKVSAELLSGDRLPYLDNLVNLRRALAGSPEQLVGKGANIFVEVHAFTPERAAHLHGILLGHVQLEEHLQRQFA